MVLPPFRLATFNLESLGRDGHAALEARIAILRPQLERLEADILCLQEVDGQKREGDPKGPRHLSALDALLAGTAYADYHRAVTLNEKGTGVRDRHNLVVLSRFPIVGSEQVRHGRVPPPLYEPVTADPPAGPQPVEWDRPLLRAEIDLGAAADGTARALHVFNLHLRAPRAAFIEGQKLDAHTWASVSGWAEGFFLAAVKSAGQALEVRLAVDAVFDDDEAALIAVCGDLNAGVRESAVRIVCGDEEDLGTGALLPRLLVPAEAGVAANRRFSVRHAGRRIMADHILMSRPLMAGFRGCEIHNEDLGDEFATPAVVRDAPESFHAPVVARFGPAGEGA
jgi:endonuclease/exonuclease/phosphatase family metal-dependent hydrolase